MVIKSSDNFKNYFIDKMFWNCRYALFVMTPFMAVCWKIDQINRFSLQELKMIFFSRFLLN